jgi:NADP-dependent 3-hydroxy acid dehydrogenase YdfG
LELATQLLSDETKHVLLGARSIEKGTTAVRALKARNLPGSVELLHIDVSNEDSITTAAKKVGEEYGR